MRRALSAILAASKLTPACRFVVQTVAQVATETGCPSVGMAALTETIGKPDLTTELGILQRQGDIEIDENSRVSLSGKYKDLSKTERAVIPTGLPTRGTRARGSTTKSLTDEEIATLKAEFSDLDNIDNRIAYALSYKTASKVTDQFPRVRQWLFDDRKKEARNGSNNRPAPSGQPRPPYRQTGGAQRTPGPDRYFDDLA